MYGWNAMTMTSTYGNNSYHLWSTYCVLGLYLCYLTQSSLTPLK